MTVSANGVDELDDELGHEVAGRRLAAEDEGARRHRQLGILLEPAVERDDVQHVQMLALVFVDALDLDVEQPGGIELNAGMRADVGGEALLVGQLDRAPVAAERGVIGMRLELAQRSQVRQP